MFTSLHYLIQEIPLGRFMDKRTCEVEGGRCGMCLEAFIAKENSGTNRSAALKGAGPVGSTCRGVTELAVSLLPRKLETETQDGLLSAPGHHGAGSPAGGAGGLERQEGSPALGWRPTEDGRAGAAVQAGRAVLGGEEKEVRAQEGVCRGTWKAELRKGGNCADTELQKAA